MRILALETTGFTGTLALLDDDRVVAERALPSDQRSAQSLAPAIQSLLQDHGWPIPSLGLIAVAQGPGSFTGLRVGVTTSKTLAYAIGADVLGVDTLEVLANQAGGIQDEARIHAVIDAQRNQLFAATFVWKAADAVAARQTSTHIADLDPWIASLQAGDVVIGPVLAKLASKLPDGILLARESDCQPRAATVGRLAWRDYAAGHRDDLWKLVPHYHRASAAEEKADRGKV